MNVVPIGHCLLAALLLFHLSTITLVAAGLSGVVHDASGGAVKDVEIVVMTPQRTVIATTRTSPDGRFQLPSLPEGRYLVAARAAGFREAMIAADVIASAESPITITLDVDQVHQEVSVTASPGSVIDRQYAAQSVNIITQDEIAQRATTVVAQAVNEEAGVHLQRTSPSMAGVFVRGLTGNKVNVFRRRRALLERRAARRRQHVPRPDRSDPRSRGIEVVHGPNSAEYGSDALGGTVQFLDACPAWRPADGGRTAMSALGGNRRIKAAAAIAALLVAGTPLRPVRGGGGARRRRAAARRRHRFARGGDALPRRAVRHVLWPIACPTPASISSTAWSRRTGRRAAARSSSPLTRRRGRTAHRYDQELGGDGNLISELNDMTLDLFYARARARQRRLVRSRSVHLFDQQPARRARQPGRPRQPARDIGHEPERTTSNGVQASVNKSLSSRASLQVGGDVYLEKLMSDAFNINPVTGARVTAPSARAERRDVHARRRVRADRIRRRRRSSASGRRRAPLGRRAATKRAPPMRRCRAAGRCGPMIRSDDPSVTFRAGAIITPLRAVDVRRQREPRLPRAAHDGPRHARTHRIGIRSGRAGCRGPQRLRRQHCGCDRGLHRRSGRAARARIELRRRRQRPLSDRGAPARSSRCSSITSTTTSRSRR